MTTNVAWNPIPVAERSLCHATRHAFKAGLCRECWQVSRVGRDQGAMRDQPARIVGTRQCGGEEIPEACPHCRARPPTWVIELATFGHCILCGEDYFRTQTVIRRPPKQANIRRDHDHAEEPAGES